MIIIFLHLHQPASQWAIQWTNVGIKVSVSGCVRWLKMKNEKCVCVYFTWKGRKNERNGSIKHILEFIYVSSYFASFAVTAACRLLVITICISHISELAIIYVCFLEKTFSNWDTLFRNRRPPKEWRSFRSLVKFGVGEMARYSIKTHTDRNLFILWPRDRGV